ncbi:MAG: AmmeMemoRadiSam system protein A [bacterium]|nr:AmmeMemoRadiSam system protein A [bacterium]
MSEAVEALTEAVNDIVRQNAKKEKTETVSRFSSGYGDWNIHEQKRLLATIARDSLESWVCDGKRLDLSAYPLTPSLEDKHGAFVTLRNGGELRGCIGYTANETPLAEAVRENAINACSRDMRFEQVGADELDHISIEISALTPGDTPETPFKAVNDIGEIVIGRDGLFIVSSDSRGGLLLPQVATEQGWDVPTFLSAVCRKAGMPDRSWEDPEVDLYRFSAQVFAESE